LPNKFSKQRRYYEEKVVSEVNDLSKEEAVYLAGLIDADGNIGFYEQKYGYMQVVSIKSTSEKLIEWLKKTVGDMSVTKIEKNYGYLKNCDGVKEMFQFNVYAKIDVKKLLSQIQPYLVIKKKEAEIVLKYLRGEIRGKEAVRQMKREKKKRKVGTKEKTNEEEPKRENGLVKFL